MTKVVGVRFKKGGKIYYFDPQDFCVNVGEHVVVETSRGVEMGECMLGMRELEDEAIVQPLRPVIRKADEQDLQLYESLKEKEIAAAEIFAEKVAFRGLEMNLVEVEYAFGGGKITFFFTAEGRVDFRELVKDLAYEFKMRIELRQIGVRDETKIVKGLGPCGREVCCGKWLADFAPVSIKMAKDQNLSLHPVKISGLCNRLMCCLGYEHETYVQISADMPGVFDKVKTPKGIGTVVSTEILKGRVSVRLRGEGKGETDEIIESFDKGDIVVIEPAGRSRSRDFAGSHGVMEAGEDFSISDLKALED